MNAEAECRGAAAAFRADHHLGVQPMGDLVAVIEQLAGIDVAVLDAAADEHGLTMRDPARGTVIIGVARTLNPMRQRSSLAHELAHVLFEDWRENASWDWSERVPEEIRADAFARHLLVPVEGLRDFLERGKPVTEADLSAVVQRFLVSPAVAAIALHSADYIDEATKQSWRSLSTRQLAMRFGWADQYRALQADSGQTRAPQRLLARAIRGYQDGVVSAQTIANLRNVQLSQAEADLRDAGILPARPVVNWMDHGELPDADVDLEALDVLLDALDAEADGSAHEPSG